nr:PREDICTED: uncharacterized protein LOC103314124 [Tribolium castaneum]|eukprot:XP_015838807.1 PREDICTED: uncharacterized protein LOC103314124 [Tribolium castaneum]
MQDDDYLEKLQQIKKQFLCYVPVKEINLSFLDKLDINSQEQVIENTIRLDQILKYPINLEYQKAFLKHLLQYFERQGSVIHDTLYEEYGRLVALPCSNINFKHYATESGKKDIILKENANLISDGTTGLRTWHH